MDVVTMMTPSERDSGLDQLILGEYSGKNQIIQNES